MEKGTITVVNRKLMPERGPNTFRVPIHRPCMLGNPFVIGLHGTREQVIEKYRAWLCDKIAKENRSFVKREFDRVCQAYWNGKDVELICGCKPQPCHGDVIKELVENYRRKTHDR